MMVKIVQNVISLETPVLNAYFRVRSFILSKTRLKSCYTEFQDYNKKPDHKSRV